MKIVGIIALGILTSLSFLQPSGVLADGGDATLIHGCVAKDGTTTIVSVTAACKKNETPTHWPTAARIVADETRITNTETKNTQQDAAIAALQGQGGGGTGGLVVKDSLGQIVGPYIAPNQTVLSVGTQKKVTVQVTTGGFPDNADVGGLRLFYKSPDCSGTPFFNSDDPSSLLGFALRLKNNLVFATAPVETMCFASSFNCADNNPSSDSFQDFTDLSQPGVCVTFTPFDGTNIGFFGPAATNFTLPAFSAPFHVE